MTVINTNTASINAQFNLNKVNQEMEKAMEQLSSGKRINSASDDAAGLAISSRMTAEVRGTAQAVRNALDGQALIDTAEGAHIEVENILQRMRELSVQSSNDTYNSNDRAMLQSEMDQLATEIEWRFNECHCSKHAH
jgi:flagellin